MYIFAPNNRASKVTKQKQTELKKEIHNSRVVTEDFNTLLSVIGRKTR
jgi:hypothetical protein